MPKYRYLCNNRRCRKVTVEEHSMAAHKTVTECDHCGSVARQLYETVRTQSSAGWPYYCDAMAVHPAQVHAEAERLAAAGIPTQFNARDGRPEVRDNQHRNKLLAFYGYHDKDACYGQRSG